MSVKEKRFKYLMGLLLVVFLVVDYGPFMAWVHEKGGLAGVNQDFWDHMFHSHMYQVTVVDLTTLASFFFIWMIWDSRRRQHPWRALLWLPAYLLAPGIAMFGYLLTRRGLPPESARR